MITGKELKKWIKRSYEESFLIKEVTIDGTNVLWLCDKKGSSIVLFCLSSVKQVTPGIVESIKTYLSFNVCSAWVSNQAEFYIVLDKFETLTPRAFREWYLDVLSK